MYGVVTYAGDADYDLAAYPAIRAWEGRLAALPGFGGQDALMPTESRAAA